MNRRGFLKFFSIAPLGVSAAIESPLNWLPPQSTVDVFPPDTISIPFGITAEQAKQIAREHLYRTYCNFPMVDSSCRITFEPSVTDDRIQERSAIVNQT